jgi:hypothetical protein
MKSEQAKALTMGDRVFLGEDVDYTEGTVTKLTLDGVEVHWDPVVFSWDYVSYLGLVGEQGPVGTSARRLVLG